MNDSAQLDLRNFLDSLSTPLAAFYQREAEQASDTCFVQPNPDGSVDEYTWQQVGDQVRRMAAYLQSLDYEPGSNIALMSSNCAHWIMADLAIWMAGHVSVPLYPVLTAKSIGQILEHSGAKAIFIGKLGGFDEMRPGIPAQVDRITFPLSPAAIREEYTDWDEVMAKCEPMADSPERSLDELATIIYTSGTTGIPKGVMHSFRSLAVVGVQTGIMYTMDSGDRKLSYLPLAHAAERASVEMNQLYFGYQIYFSDSLQTFPDDLRRARPTLFFAVPRIWTKFQQGVHAQVPESKLKQLLASPESASEVRQSMTASLGLDQVRVAASGASPLSTSLIDWYRQLGIEILEGYGMTENFAYSHVTREGESRVGYVGTASNFVECKISDVGEVLIKSPADMMGYYKEPELSAGAFDSDGFLLTGDKGEIDAEGRLKITGRIKELFKTSKGKYVAPAPIEDLLLRNTNLEQVCVAGGADLASPIALVTLSEQAAKSMDDVGSKQNLISALEDLLVDTNKLLDKHEALASIVVLPEPWTIENNMMTPTLKIKRDLVEKAHQENFESWSEVPGQIIIVAG